MSAWTACSSFKAVAGCAAGVRQLQRAVAQCIRHPGLSEALELSHSKLSFQFENLDSKLFRWCMKEDFLCSHKEYIEVSNLFFFFSSPKLAFHICTYVVLPFSLNPLFSHSALAEAATGKKVLHIPYRDSVLTKLLQSALGGNSKTIMVN